MIGVAEALDVILSRIGLMGTERVMLDRAAGRVLAEDIVAGLSVPPFDNSAMDGYAVRSADIAALPARLHVAGELAAGLRWEGELGPGQALRIMTGAPVPGGADIIVR